jgi:Intracellular proteinase inhibitor
MSHHHFFRVITVLLLITTSAFGADLLNYTLQAKPGNLVVDRRPTTDPNRKPYEEELLFTVTNPRRSDFKGTAPNCQTFDVEIFFVGIDRETSVWKWSAGRHFCQHQTNVRISAGKSWTPDDKVTWTFKAGDVKDGKYHTVATFIPTGNKTAVANFVITSTQ